MAIAPDYDPKLFVTPGEAYRRVLAKVQRWKEASPQGPSGDKLWRARHLSSQAAPGDQVLGLVGERGGGKTWLLRHLAEDDRDVSPQAVYLDLDNRTRFSEPEEYAQSVEDQIGKRCGDSRAILLLDTLPPYLDEHLRKLEASVLKPHLMQRGSLVIMALVHPLRVCWRLPALRGTERYVLPPFSESQTNEQLQRLRKAKMARTGLKASQVQRSSAGLPLLNYLLATREGVEPHEALLQHWLSRVPTDDHNRVRTCLETVCTLDTLEHAQIQRALEVVHRHHPVKGRVLLHPGDVRNLLRKHWLARPMPDAPGRIVVVDSVRQAAREVLQARDADLYAALEEIA